VQKKEVVSAFPSQNETDFMKGKEKKLLPHEKGKDHKKQLT